MKSGKRELLRAALQTPWKIRNELLRQLLFPVTWLYFLWHGVPWGARWRVFGLPLIQRNASSTIRIGAGLEMRNWFSSNPLGIQHRTILATWSKDATIRIGNNVGITGATICAQTSIVIGDRVLIGANSSIVDTDFHPLAAHERIMNPSAGLSLPIVIEDNVFIGMNCLILKGVRIGSESIVGAGSVVTRDVPPRVIVAGNPARLIRTIEGE